MRWSTRTPGVRKKMRFLQIVGLSYCIGIIGLFGITSGNIYPIVMYPICVSMQISVWPSCIADTGPRSGVGGNSVGSTDYSSVCSFFFNVVYCDSCNDCDVYFDSSYDEEILSWKRVLIMWIMAMCKPPEVEEKKEKKRKSEISPNAEWGPGKRHGWRHYETIFAIRASSRGKGGGREWGNYWGMR